MSDRVDVPQKRVEKLREEVSHAWPTPAAVPAYIFLVTEVGELGDALIRDKHFDVEWSRNNKKESSVEKELGDVYLMLCSTASALGIDLEATLEDTIDRIRKKYV